MNLGRSRAGTYRYVVCGTIFLSYGLTLLIEIVIGFFYGGGQADLEKVNQILAGIDAQFTINPLLLIPPVIIIILAFRKIPAVPGIVIGIMSAGILGVYTVRQTLMGLGGWPKTVDLKQEWYLSETVRDLKERAVLFLEEILENGGYFAAVAQSQFVDSGSLPERDDGIAWDPAGGAAAGSIICLCA
jgi:hypothetical protein